MNTPEKIILPDGKGEPIRLSRKERRANLASARRAMKAWKKKGGGTSVAPQKEAEENEQPET